MWINIFNLEEKEGETRTIFLPEDVLSPSMLNTKVKKDKDAKRLTGTFPVENHDRPFFSYYTA